MREEPVEDQGRGGVLAAPVGDAEAVEDVMGVEQQFGGAHRGEAAGARGAGRVPGPVVGAGGPDGGGQQEPARPDEVDEGAGRGAGGGADREGR